jgi:hypothetical protein
MIVCRDLEMKVLSGVVGKMKGKEPKTTMR